MSAQLIIGYMVIMNLFCFLLFALDKQKAKKRRNRISERTLWIVAIAGGAIGGWIGMQLFRHKTKKISFKIGLPTIGVIHILTVFYCIQQLS